MTIWGIDIASYQAGIDLKRVRAEGFDFVIAKATEGDSYTNPEYVRQRDGARANGLAFCAYHYVQAKPSAAAQVDRFERAEPDKNVPVMLDHEHGSGGVDVLRAVHTEFVRRGHRVVLTYLPRWYWAEHIGKPDLTGLPPLMASDYGPERAGYASVIYPGDQDRGWTGYGGLNVSILQFSQKGRVAGMNVDVDAFRGTRAELDALFNGSITLDKEGPRVGLDQAQQNTILEGAAQLRPHAPAENRPGLRKLFNPHFYNTRDNVKGGWGWSIFADIWNEVVWDGYPNPVDEFDKVPAEKVRRGGLVSYVLGIYRDVTLLTREVAKLRAEVAALSGSSK
ncbi:glycoside hydrolase family 25 protein [Rhodococcus sp. NPDC003994]